MPTTIAALVIILFAVLPGVPANSVYKIFFGIDWRETEWEGIVRVIGFSLAGLVAYTVVASIVNLPPPIYVIPATFDPGSYSVQSLLPIAAPLVGHFASSIVLAILFAFVLRFASRWAPVSFYPAAWDDFVRNDVPDHWVVVRLNNGETYAGILKGADISVDQTERDIVLAEPAQFIKRNNTYKTIPYQQLFIPASLIVSVAVVHDPKRDSRTTAIGSNPFSEESNNV